MYKQLNQEKLLYILKEIQKLGNSNNNLTSRDLVKEIKKMLLNRDNVKSL